ncbi:hypothetical protein HBA43_21465 [Providencia rettgeri]|uniref:hypothetical protein n=1 Tax=Providencia rettgeri TaxID=587 RepID=UPI00141A0D7A|nr:hypothetical protein [Providencia rettgeri]NIA76722.1 hypothetical protein [Providencia rettgeri]NIA80941.1 hypothetical protein [Providencia rettgeri]NIB04188.1 hypothetical protein [Providencia rettgeri]NIB08391.1 hypothetical protein [Providencia rettgeri]NIB21998.1 hypothetical protein [Providencia rettgeri]
MKDEHNTIVALDKIGRKRIVIGSLNELKNAIVIKEGGKHSGSDEFKWSYMDEVIVALWETFNVAQQEAIKDVIQRYRNEVFSLECSINEGTAS